MLYYFPRLFGACAARNSVYSLQLYIDANESHPLKIRMAFSLYENTSERIVITESCTGT